MSRFEFNGRELKALDVSCTTFLSKRSLKYGAEVKSKSREASELKFAGSLNKKDDLSSLKRGLVGVEQRFLGKFTT